MGKEVPILQVLELMDESRQLDEVELLEILAHQEEQFISHLETMTHPQYFFGRKQELAHFEETLQDTPVLVVTGIAGIGKTTLCAKFTENQKDRYNRFWFDFREWTTIHGLLDRFSRFLADLGHGELKTELQKKETPPLETLERILRRVLPDSDTMLVFDDFQFATAKIVELFKLLVHLAGQSEGTRIIISCRVLPDVPFYDRRDATVRNIVNEYNLKGLDMEGCREMLAYRGIEVEEEDLRSFWIKLGGHPFFFEVIGSARNISSIISEERDISMFLDDEIYAQLSEGERDVMGFASVFREAVPAHLIENSLDDAGNILPKLVKRSLLVAEAGDAYHTHTILKEFFYGKLEPSRMREFHGIAAGYYETGGSSHALTELPYHLLKARRLDEALQTVSASAEELITQGKAEELEEILEELEQVEMGNAWSKIGLLKATVDMAKGNFDLARVSLLEMLNRKTEMDPKIVANIYKKLGYLEGYKANWDDAQSNYERALSISMSIKDERGLAEAYEGIGSVAFRKGDHKTAIDYNTRCLEAAENLGDLGLQTSSSIDLGLSFYYGGEIDEAIRYFGKSLDLLDVKGSSYQKARVLNNLGACHFMQDSYDKALENWERCLQISTANGFSNFEAAAYVNAADIYSRKEEWDRAKEYLTFGEEIYTKLDHRVGMGYATLTWALYYKRKGDWKRSEKYFKKAIDMARENKTLDNLAENYLEMGFMYRDKGDKKKARKCYEEALKIYREQNNETLIARMEREITVLEI